MELLLFSLVLVSRTAIQACRMICMPFLFQFQNLLELQAQESSPTPTSPVSDSTNLAIPLGVSFGVTALIVCAVIAAIAIVVKRSSWRFADLAAKEGVPNKTYGSERCIKMYGTMQLMQYSYTGSVF